MPLNDGSGKGWTNAECATIVPGLGPPSSIFGVRAGHDTSNRTGEPRRGRSEGGSSSAQSIRNLQVHAADRRRQPHLADDLKLGGETQRPVVAARGGAGRAARQPLSV